MFYMCNEIFQSQISSNRIGKLFKERLENLVSRNILTKKYDGTVSLVIS